MTIMLKVHTTYGIIVSWQILRHTVQGPLQGRTCCPAVGSMVSRVPPTSALSRSASDLEGLLAQGHALPGWGGYKGQTASSRVNLILNSNASSLLV